MKTTWITKAVFTLVLGGNLSLPAAAGEKPRATCTLASISGAYGYAMSGVVVEGGVTTNLAFAGTLNFDGAGTVTGSDITNFGGQPLPLETFAGTYKVKGNCTGTYKVQSTESGTLSGYFTIVTAGDEIDLVGTESGAVYAGPARRR